MRCYLMQGKQHLIFLVLSILLQKDEGVVFEIMLQKGCFKSSK